ncbi:uncharacterized protein PFL1_00946 [Pseudozyma flocculosa PF-1]|uniref:Uncharacterized protein n=1 Tax=Pseudozyma flocculosa TaxID=84751 RepID=A0A5C3FAK7_9BASI|nr:uncharacterized protein PFL1_00946 [Pseudozyma flocculosa PF-1]EPQ31613.1 hypothetical protein PFL1_00946 [Pseudozyma flocculosa PF-1]SPO40727.1 uncharacterized protein PSFLO_06209 [Pseudozyma flocculosa]
MTSRKRRTGDERLASPPLHAQPLLVRNLVLLPVSLIGLAHDATFVEPLRLDVAALLSDFARRWLARGPANDGGAEADQRASPFHVFTQAWIHGGWDYVHFAYTDHRETQTRFCETISRVFLERLLPLARSQEANKSAASLSDDDALAAVGVVFALFLLWDTQIFPQAGVGIAHCRRAMETIKVEADLLDLLLKLPALCRPALNTGAKGAGPSQPSASPHAAPPEADLIYVLRRLCGLDCQVGDSTADDESGQEPRSKRRKRTKTNRYARVTMADRVEVSSSILKIKGREGNPILDVIPPTNKATRIPRIFPSSRLMTRAQGDRSFHRVARAVAVRYEDEAESEKRGGSESPAGPRRPDGSNDAQLADGDQATNERQSATRRMLGSLSRSDVLRLRAMQRLGLDAIGALSGASLQQLRSEPAAESDEEEVEIEHPSWVGLSRYTIGLRTALEADPQLPDVDLDEIDRRGDEYKQARARLMRTHSRPDRREALQDRVSAADDVDGTGAEVGTHGNDSEGQDDGEEAHGIDDDGDDEDESDSDHDDSMGGSEDGDDSGAPRIDYPALLFARFAAGEASTGSSILGDDGVETGDLDVESTASLSIAEMWRWAARRTNEAFLASRNEAAGPVSAVMGARQSGARLPLAAERGDGLGNSHRGQGSDGISRDDGNGHVNDDG